MLRYVFEPGFFGSGPVHVALAVGTVIAITSAVVGVFTVMRGQSFAGHSLADIATTGGSGAFLIGLNQFWGYLAFGVGAAAFMEMIGVQRRRGRDVATGVVLGAALGAGRALPLPGHPGQLHDRRVVHDPVRLHVRHHLRPPCPP